MEKLSMLVDASLAIEKERVEGEVRQTHIVINGLKVLVATGQISRKSAEEILEQWKKRRILPDAFRLQLSDPETDELVRRVRGLEDYVDGRVADLIKAHPAYPWFSRVKGVGGENIGKIVGPVRVKPADFMVCVNKECDTKRVPREDCIDTICPSCEETLVEAGYADTISALWMFSGWAPGEDGKAMRRVKGEKLPYNSQLRSMGWRLGQSLVRAKGKFYSYPEKGVGYIQFKETYRQRFENQGFRVVPASALPTTGGKKYEPEGVISEGHLHNMALRRTIKLFLACLWLVWREAEGLPVTKPYAIDKLGHVSFIDPWEMVDR